MAQGGERARDALGRPLPAGTAAEPADSAAPVLAGQLDTPADVLDAAQRLIASGHAFAAHEVLEAQWKGAPARDRDFWQGLAQVAVGLTHCQRGNAVGAARLLRRGAERLSAYRPAGRVHGVDVAALADAALSMAGRIDIAGTDGMPVQDFVLRGEGSG